MKDDMALIRTLMYTCILASLFALSACYKPISDGNCPSDVVLVRVLKDGVNVIRDTTINFALERIAIEAQASGDTLPLLISDFTPDYYFKVQDGHSYLVGYDKNKFLITVRFGTSNYDWCDRQTHVGVTQLVIDDKIICQGNDCIDNNRLIINI